jgi:hypothetical protein
METENSYRKYRMEDYEWIGTYKERMGAEGFREYRDRVYEMLHAMKPGTVFTIDLYVREYNLDLFIKIVCLFITEGNSCWEFSDDYKNIRRHEKAECTDKKKQKLSSRGTGAGALHSLRAEDTG